METIKVNLSQEKYDIHIEKGMLKEAAKYIREIYSGNKVMVITDDRVFPLWGEILRSSLKKEYQDCHVLMIPHGEKSKNMDQAKIIYEELIKKGFARTDLIIAFGGGVVGDLAGFVAATYLRGIPFVQVPTTLLAQVDSSVGGKVAIDLEQGKNLVGAFYHPKMVLIDPQVLETLSQRVFSDGMAEVIKYGCIEDRELFELIKTKPSDLTEIIQRCVDCKRRIVELDEKDFGQRMTLNFGHTMGHAIEQYYGYERETHGEAVAIGMYQVLEIAEKKGLTKAGTKDQLKEVLELYKLPYENDVPKKELLQGINKDKKNMEGKLNVVLLNEIGNCYLYETTPEFFS